MQHCTLLTPAVQKYDGWLPNGYPVVPNGYPGAHGYPAVPNGYSAVPNGYPAVPNGYPRLTWVGARYTCMSKNIIAEGPQLQWGMVTQS